MRQVGAMEQMYQDYKDIAEFRMVYITEAHAIDSDWPMGVAEEKNIKQHTEYDERCATAEMLISDEELTIPTLIDGMDNAVNQAYRAHPDRVFLIRSDGRLAVAAERGPWGFAPGLEAAQEWLADFRENGSEPELPEGLLEAADERAAAKDKKSDDK
ncbi:MAG: deiodinase-like protein [Pirellulaceae bacterium]